MDSFVQVAADQSGQTQPVLGQLGKRIKRALVAIGLAAAVCSLPLGAANAMPSEEPDASFRLEKNGTLFIIWSGKISPDMAPYLQRVFLKHSAQARRVILVLNSQGGSVVEGEKVIAVMRDIRKTHRLDTLVLHGALCASMCVPLYLQGEDRIAAGATLWVFHQVTTQEPGSPLVVDDKETHRLFEAYFEPAGVNRKWLESILLSMKNTDLWMTGVELFADKTGIIRRKLDDRTDRAELAGARGAGSPQPAHTRQ
jgi:ATP-dependent protease ClpP protease subunit